MTAAFLKSQFQQKSTAVVPNNHEDDNIPVYFENNVVGNPIMIDDNETLDIETGNHIILIKLQCIVLAIFSFL